MSAFRKIHKTFKLVIPSQFFFFTFKCLFNCYLFTDAIPCPVDPWLPAGLTGVLPIPTSLRPPASFTQTFSCDGGFGVPFDTAMGYSSSGGIKLNTQTISCNLIIQGNTLGFNTSTGHSIDVSRFSCLRKFSVMEFCLFIVLHCLAATVLKLSQLI